jgi:hypothetical protein
VFTARYALSSYIKQIRFVFEGLIHICQAVPLSCRFGRDFTRPRHSAAGERHGRCELTSAVSWRPVGDLPRFGFFRLTRGHSRMLLARMLLPFRMCLICFDDDEDIRLYRIIHFYELMLKLKPAFLLLSCYVSIMCSSFLCGRQLFQVVKFRSTHSKLNIWITFAPHFSDVQTEYEILLPLRLLETYYEASIYVQGGAAGGGGVAGLQPHQSPKTEI